jgi:hypothetical protein
MTLYRVSFYKDLLNSDGIVSNACSARSTSNRTARLKAIGAGRTAGRQRTPQRRLRRGHASEPAIMKFETESQSSRPDHANTPGAAASVEPRHGHGPVCLGTCRRRFRGISIPHHRLVLTVAHHRNDTRARTWPFSPCSARAGGRIAGVFSRCSWRRARGLALLGNRGRLRGDR